MHYYDIFTFTSHCFYGYISGVHVLLLKHFIDRNVNNNTINVNDSVLSQARSTEQYREVLVE